MKENKKQKVFSEAGIRLYKPLEIKKSKEEKEYQIFKRWVLYLAFGLAFGLLIMCVQFYF